MSNLPYVTTFQSPRYQQTSFEDILTGRNTDFKPIVFDKTATRTVFIKNIDQIIDNEDIYNLKNGLCDFVSTAKGLGLYDKPREELYNTFFIPKKSGGVRRIDAPNEDLMQILRMLKFMIEYRVGEDLYHTAAFGYIHGRNSLKAVTKHQQNESNWFLKIDFSNFFGNTTLDFVYNMLSEVYPFSEVIKTKEGNIALKNTLDLCFLNGGLPQGTPVSPMLTNIMMIPIDHMISKRLRETNQNFVYTRYADDILISSRQDFDKDAILKLVKDVLDEFDTPFSFNNEKTRYGSRSGRNWNLGLMLNKDNEITVGSKNKKRFRAMVSNYILDKQNGKQWDLESIQHFQGVMNYYRSIEPSYIKSIIDYNNEKYGVNLEKMIKEDLKL